MAETFKTRRGRGAHAGDMTETTTPTITPQLDVVGVIVNDMARSLAFYRRLGLDVPAEADTEPHVELALPGGIRVTWDTVDTIRSFDPDYEQPAEGAASNVGLAFRLDTPAEVDAVYAALVAAGYDGHLTPWDAFWGQRYAQVHDPDGTHVDLFAPLPPA
jgi:catechol 2,3-dioxygenase-like lactoylglutathione lyase family enzyme